MLRKALKAKKKRLQQEVEANDALVYTVRKKHYRKIIAT